MAVKVKDPAVSCELSALSVCALAGLHQIITSKVAIAVRAGRVKMVVLFKWLGKKTSFHSTISVRIPRCYDSCYVRTLVRMHWKSDLRPGSHLVQQRVSYHHSQKHKRSHIFCR